MGETLAKSLRTQRRGRRCALRRATPIQLAFTPTALTRISHKIRRERPEIECWCEFRADERVKLGRHPAKS